MRATKPTLCPAPSINFRFLAYLLFPSMMKAMWWGMGRAEITRKRHLLKKLTMIQNIQFALLPLLFPILEPSTTAEFCYNLYDLLKHNKALVQTPEFTRLNRWNDIHPKDENRWNPQMYFNLHQWPNIRSSSSIVFLTAFSPFLLWEWAPRTKLHFLLLKDQLSIANIWSSSIATSMQRLKLNCTLHHTTPYITKSLLTNWAPENQKQVK